LHQGDVILDVGSHVGLFALKALENGASKVIAIEPNPQNIECLRRNLKNEIASGKVVIYAKGAWDKDDFLEMSEVPDDSGEDSFVIQYKNSKETGRLPLTTIDKIVMELSLERVDYIKMDIEGAERMALAGASESIRRWHPRMAICVYHLPDDPIVIPAVINKTGLDYQQKCGSCILTDRILPQVYFFY
jgi:FkbM family methyltransferase